MKSKKIQSRKQEHIDLTLKRDVSFTTKSAGFDRLDFLHNALPEINYSEIDTTTEFLGKKIQLPFIVSSMTGGFKNSERINAQIAEVCAEKKIAMGVGSQRYALDQPENKKSFSIVRKIARDIPVFGNLGAAEVARLKDAAPVQKLVDMIEADGFAVHVNPVQELMQREGCTDYRGVLQGIGMLVRSLTIPVIVKEVGAGISLEAAKRLIDAGVMIIDVAGAGGTSWAGVELLRRTKTKKRDGVDEEAMLKQAFWNWGIPTVDALKQLRSLKGEHPALKIIASGGITSGMDAAKSIALGASYAASARPVIQTVMRYGVAETCRLFEVWEKELRGAMFLTGSRTIQDLQQQQLMEYIPRGIEFRTAN